MYDNQIIDEVSKEVHVQKVYVSNIMELINAGNTIPFIARYRKESHGSMDDQIIRTIVERFEYLKNLYEKKDDVIRLIDEQGKLTDELRNSILSANTVTEVDDIYRPYRPKKRTRASIAKENGLQGLSDAILDGKREIEILAEQYINEKVPTVGDAINGAKDIIAESVSDNADYRKYIRQLTFSEGLIVTKKSSDEDSVYSMYYEYKEAVNRIADHRVLAINRGEKEKFLSVKIEAPIDKILQYLSDKIIISKDSKYVMEAIEDAYKRLISSSIENEIRNTLTEKAEESSLIVFKNNLKQLLMQPPINGKVILSLDPGYRMGCKVAVIDKKGDVVDTSVIYLTKPKEDIEGSKKLLSRFINDYDVDLIAIGNGTASEETEIFVSEFLKEIDKKIFYVIVNEAGASVYSASKLASEEYPEYDVNIRSAIALAQRVQDPLSQLVKVEPKAIGVGQYQHDMNQKRLTEVLGGVVEDCVNNVGVDLNTASSSLLNYVSGVSKQVADNIVKYRRENGSFKNRKQILKVAKVGPKVFQQCAGFLRIAEGTEVLDNTGVHPESYDVTKKLLEQLGYTLEEVQKKEVKISNDDINEELAKKLSVGYPTLCDISKELMKPGRDPREDFSRPVMRSSLMDLKDLKEGMVVDGVVKNVVAFGAFVDIVGVHADGLVHISNMCNKFIKNPLDVVSVGQAVKAKIVSIDIAKGRIGLSMKDL